jgi:O-antigen/teichoic acid export membrane protein
VPRSPIAPSARLYARHDSGAGIYALPIVLPTKLLRLSVSYRHPSVGLVAACDAGGVFHRELYQADARAAAEVPMIVSGPGRARRLLSGWGANLVQMVLGITQQVALVPVFLHFWTSDVLAAWLAVYAAGNLVYIADAGLQFRSINRFLAFKSCVDCDGRTGQYYAAMLRIYFGFMGLLAVVLVVVAGLLPPSVVLGFQATSHFDAAFLIMTVGILLTLPANLTTALYRARGLYGRAVQIQSLAMLASQLGQLVAVVTTGSLLAVAIAYVATQLAVSAYFLVVDANRLFPFLRGARGRQSWSWVIGQFRIGAPFVVGSATELALLNLPVLLVSAFVTDRVAVAQWGLTRVVAGLLRALCLQMTLPLAAELGHDHAVGLKEQLRNLYARGSAFVALLASLVVSGLLPFWPDFFALWTNGAIPYDPLLTMTLLIGTSAIAPSILALGYANYSNRGNLVARVKGLQLAVFLILSVALIRPMGPLGAAIAIVASDLLIQFGLLGIIIIRQTLRRPFRHVAFLATVMAVVTLGGWGLGTVIRSLTPGPPLMRFVLECTLWLGVVALVASPLLNKNLRDRLIAAIPR